MRLFRLRQSGTSLLEITLALGLMAMLLMPVIALMQTSLSLNVSRNSSHANVAEQHALMRNVVRHGRDIDTVLAITKKQLRARLVDGRVVAWRHSRGRVQFKDRGKWQTIASNVSDMVVEGFGSDGTTKVAKKSRIGSVRFAITVVDASGVKQTVETWYRVRRYGGML